MRKSLVFLTFWSTSVIADTTDEAVKFMNYVNAQGACSAYAEHSGKSFISAGFRSEEATKKASDKHSELGSNGAKEMISFFLNNKVDGKYMVFKENEKFCFGTACFNNKEYLEALFLISAIQEGVQQVTQKEISCPDGAWYPCKGGEPVNNWSLKAAKLYEDKNCTLLVP